MTGLPRSIYDIYKCPRCAGNVADGDHFCRHCGAQFTAEEIAQMKRRTEMPDSTTLLVLLIVAIVIGVAAFLLSRS